MRCPGARACGQRVHAGKVERDRLLLALFAYAGLRRSELLGLDCDDVDLDRRLIRVRNAKGGRQRVVPIHPGLVPLFVAYAATRAARATPRGGVDDTDARPLLRSRLVAEGTHTVASVAGSHRWITAPSVSRRTGLLR